jgi:hypothetical protein
MKVAELQQSSALCACTTHQLNLLVLEAGSGIEPL